MSDAVSSGMTNKCILKFGQIHIWYFGEIHGAMTEWCCAMTGAVVDWQQLEKETADKGWDPALHTSPSSPSIHDHHNHDHNHDFHHHMN